MWKLQWLIDSVLVKAEINSKLRFNIVNVRGCAFTLCFSRRGRPL